MRTSRLQKKFGIHWIVKRGEEVWVARAGKLVHAKGAEASQLLLAAEQSKAQLIMLKDSVLDFPTGIDWQVHLRYPGQSEKEELLGGLYSALDGGFDTVLSMPNTRPFLDEPKVLRETIAGAAAEINKADLPLRALFTASATKGMQGLEPTDVAALAQAGAAAITDDGWGVKSPEAQEALFRACAASGLVFLQHAEVHGHKGVASPSTFQRTEGLNPYPENAESDMIRRDLELLRRVPKARYHVLHVSTERSVALIRQAKSDGLLVTAEASPHHLFFDNTDIPPQTDPRSSYFKFNPPLFSPEDRESLRTALREGVLDFVATDHAPHEQEAKQAGWALAPFGTRGMETALPVLISLMKAGVLSRERVAEVFSWRARDLLPEHLRTKPSGVIFVDPEESYTVELGDLPGKSDNSCFLGQALSGRIFLRIEEDGSLYKTN